MLAKREATKAEESYQIARQAADGLVVDIAQGLRNVEGMPTASVKRILETAKGVVDRLAASAPDDVDLRKSHVLMLRQFAINYTALGDLATALDSAVASVEGARRIEEAASDDASRQLLAYSLVVLGNVQRGKGTLDAARASFEEAIAIADKMDLNASSRTTGQEIKARTLNDVSNLAVVRGETAQALEAATASVGIARALCAADPSNPSWRICWRTVSSAPATSAAALRPLGPRRPNSILPSRKPRGT